MVDRLDHTCSMLECSLSERAHSKPYSNSNSKFKIKILILILNSNFVDVTNTNPTSSFERKKERKPHRGSDTQLFKP